MQTPEANSIDGVKSFIINWNYRYPLDFWWRKKYSIPFGSKEHLDAKQFDIIVEFFENKMMNESSEKNDDISDDFNILEPYVPGSGKIFRSRPTTQKFSESDSRLLGDIKSLEDLGFSDDGKIIING